MQSFALYYKSNGKDSDEKCPITKVHFNLWTECEWKNNTSYLDVGFLIQDPDLVTELDFCIPFEIKKSDIFDLGHLLNDTKLASAIFNDSLLKDDEKSNDDVYACLYSEKLKYDVYFLDVEKHTSIEKIEEKDREKKSVIDTGSLLKINIENLRTNIKQKDDNNNFYIRFRLKNVDLEKLVHEYSTNKNGLQSIFNVTYTVDFRINNKRSLPNTFLTEDMKGCSQMIINSLHFLLITKTHVTLDTKNESSSRKLEKNIWDEYVKENNSNNATTDLIAYHYKKDFLKEEKEISKIQSEWKKSDGSYELFLKYSVEKSIMRTYLFLTIFVGVFSSLIASICSVISKNYLIKLLNENWKSFLCGIIITVIVGFLIQGITNLIKLFKQK